jgi:hypothetical protein
LVYGYPCYRLLIFLLCSVVGSKQRAMEGPQLDSTDVAIKDIHAHGVLDAFAISRDVLRKGLLKFQDYNCVAGSLAAA